MDSDELSTESSLITNEIAEETLGLSINQLELLNKEGHVLSLELFQKELDALEDRPSKMIQIAQAYVGCGFSYSFSMDTSQRDVSERFCVHLLGGMNGYDSIISIEDFCNKKPTEFYNFDDCLDIFNEKIQDARC